ncbi:MAG: hypothetical protein C0608_11275 [Deltaproteobacteria bacterium]|nr:MAG: hypothetical protein C0608_11275 [Deltaproteobacteria bacterium]
MLSNINKILIVEDDSGMSALMERLLSAEGYEVTAVDSAEAAMTKLEKESFGLVVTDLVLGAIGGEHVVRKVKEDHTDTEVIVITAHASVESAIELMKIGAFDYLRKPLLPEEIIHAVKKALEMKELRDEVKALRERVGNSSHRIFGRSPSMTKLLKRVSRAAQTQAIVLIEGESGTGKELLAHALHDESPRSKGPFIAVNLGAIPPNLIESELFGHVKGAFTGAEREHVGYFEAANGGTLFLDEIGELELHLQVKLLRVLQERRVTRVGETVEREIDVRFVAATNMNLLEEVNKGNFRNDLYYRLKVVHVVLPPLRERKSDIPLLAHLFMRRYSEKYGKNFTKIGPKAARILQLHDFPGNVRELENIIESVIATGRGRTIRPAHLKEALGENIFENVITQVDEPDEPFGFGLERVVEKYEQRYLLRMLERHNGKIKEVAKSMQMSRRTIERKMKKYGFERSDFR